MGLADRDVLLLFSDGRKVQVLKTLLLQDIAHQIIFMQALHDDDDYPLGEAIQPREQGAAVPVLHVLQLQVTGLLTSLEWIIDDDGVVTTILTDDLQGGTEETFAIDV